MIQVVPCDRCEGSGKRAQTPCRVCGGNGLDERRTKINVRVPQGVDDGTQLILRGQGEDGPFGGPAGDLYVTVRVKPHPFLIRRGKDIIYEVEINFAQAALGTSISVPTLTGDQPLSVKQGTQSGDILRMKGEGMSGRFGKGDQLVHINVVVPKKLNRKQRQLIEELGKELDNKTGRKAWWWR
jgi:molecular chaperone DnaJ